MSRISGRCDPDSLRRKRQPRRTRPRCSPRPDVDGLLVGGASLDAGGLGGDLQRVNSGFASLDAGRKSR